MSPSTLNQSTGTLAGARRAAQSRPRVAAGLLRPRPRADRQEQNALLVPDVALGSDQAGRYVLVVNGENVVEQRKVRTGPLRRRDCA